MKRKRLIAGVMFAVNAPWIVLWWRLTAPEQAAAGSTSTLFLLLIVAGLGLVVVPAVLVNKLFPRRWILIVVLACVNLFWGLRWIDAYNRADPGDVVYASYRPFFATMILLSSIAAVAVYGLVGRLLNRPRHLARM